MTDQPSASATSSSWHVSGDEAAELMRLHREQLLAYEDIATEPPDEAEGEPSRPQELTHDDLADDVRALVADYEQARPDVRLTPLRYITIGSPDGTTVIGSADLPEDGLVSLVVTRTIADAEHAEVTSRILVAQAVVTKQAS
jgi:hypothetical protein